MKKNILQAFSAGYDSTYLLIKNLKNGDNVYPVYVFTNFIHPIKQKIENFEAKNIIKRLQKKYKNLHDLTEVDFLMYPIDNIFSTQPIAWILALFKETKKNQYSVKFNEVHISYIKNDSAIAYLNDINGLWKQLFLFSDIIGGNYIPKLCFPLLKRSKTKIIEEIRNYDKDLLSLCWTCERPKIIKKIKNKNNSLGFHIEACKQCCPCKNLNKTKKVSFDAIKKYKVVFKYEEFRNKLNIKLNNIIKNEDISPIHPKYTSVNYSNTK